MDGFVQLLIPTRVLFYANSKPHRPAIYNRQFPAEQTDKDGFKCLLVLSDRHALDHVNHRYALILGIRARRAD